MNAYVIVKTVHIISAAVLFGTGMGIAFFMLRAYLSGSQDTLLATTRNVVLADWLFTTPAVAVQLISGIWLMLTMNIAFGSLWFLLVISLFAFVGLCWIPVVGIQMKIHAALKRGATVGDVSGLMRLWIALGIPAFSSVVLLYVLMVSKYGSVKLLFG